MWTLLLTRSFCNSSFRLLELRLHPTHQSFDISAGILQAKQLARGNHSSSHLRAASLRDSEPTTTLGSDPVHPKDHDTDPSTSGPVLALGPA